MSIYSSGFFFKYDFLTINNFFLLINYENLMFSFLISLKISFSLFHQKGKILK